MENQENINQENINESDLEIKDQQGKCKGKMPRVNLLVLIFSVLIAMLVTFETTFLILSSANRRESKRLAEEYNELLKEYENELEDIKANVGEFSSVAELFSAIPKEDRNIELYKKLVMIDYYYRNLYANEIDEDALIYHLLNGYVAGTGDKHGEYYTADDFKSLTQENQGNTVGIGAYINYSIEYDAIKILSVMKDSPAHKAGIKAGDIILYVDGKSVSELGYYVAIEHVKGEPGTEVNLTILRDGKQLDVTATRASVETESVMYHQYELDNTVGVIRIIDFNNATPNQFKDAITDLKSKGVTSLVFDLRNNPGGTLSSVVEMLDYLLPEGDIAHVTDASGNIQKTYKSDSEYLKGIDKMAVLVNENTASAAELFTCALKDYELATVVGTKTYGKGSMQTIYMLPDGTGLRLTTNKYNPPKSPNYDGVGIAPHVEVEICDELKDKSQFEYTDSEDNQLKEAYNRVKGANN